jgi:uncharacterized Zn finger protein
MITKIICPNCSTDKDLAVATNVLKINSGPEGPLHVIQCLRCGKEIYTTTLPHNVRGVHFHQNNLGIKEVIPNV